MVIGLFRYLCYLINEFDRLGNDGSWYSFLMVSASSLHPFNFFNLSDTSDLESFAMAPTSSGCIHTPPRNTKFFLEGNILQRKPSSVGLVRGFRTANS